jgi:Fe-S cluster assembly iron-binding protein IscA
LIKRKSKEKTHWRRSVNVKITDRIHAIVWNHKQTADTEDNFMNKNSFTVLVDLQSNTTAKKHNLEGHATQNSVVFAVVKSSAFS